MSDVNPCISEDLWFDILKELPVKILGKCRCVCKSWYALVVSPSFMAAHLKHYTRNDSNSLLLHKDYFMGSKPGDEDYEKYVFYRHFGLKAGMGSSLHSSIFPFPISHWSRSFHLVGSVHGLLCISDQNWQRDTDRIVIWNPLLQKCIILPKSKTVDNNCILGFGYECRKNDHRVLKLGRYHGAWFVEIYSVQERSWRTISADYAVQHTLSVRPFSQCFVNGFVHWFSSSEEGDNCFIPKSLLLFNVAEETFDKMELPGAFVKKIFHFLELGVFEYQSKLSVSRCGPDSCGGSLSCEVWVSSGMNNWCKVVNVSVGDYNRRFPIQYLGRNKELIGFFTKREQELVSYDPKTRQTNGLNLFASESTRFLAYSESLVLLDSKLDARCPYLRKKSERRSSKRKQSKVY